MHHSFPKVPLLPISVSIKKINKESPSRTGFNRNPANCTTYRWAVWKTSYYDSDRMMHSLVKITPLMLPPLSFSSALLFFRPFLMTGLRNCPEGSEPFLCLCPVGLPQDHGDCLSHLKAFLP